MRNITLLFLLLAGMTNSILAQGNFVPGEIYDNYGETLRGYVNLGSADDNAAFCLFKAQQNAKSEEYHPADIQGYSLDSLRRYVSRFISFNGEIRHVFLEILVDGILDLYYYDFANWTYFYLEKDGQLYLLDNSSEEVEIDGKSFIANSNSYIATMKILMQDAFVMMDDIESTTFDHKSIVKTTREYHDLVCPDEVCTVYYNDREYLDDRKWTIRVGPSIGFVWTSFQMDSELADYGRIYLQNSNDFILTYTKVVHNATFKSSGTGLRAGLFLNMNWAKRSSIQFEADYSYMKAPELLVNSLVIPVLYQFNILRDARVNPYLEIGFAPIICFETKPIDRIFEYDELEWYDQQGNTTYVHKSESLAPSSTNYAAFLCGAGVEYLLNSGNALRFNIRYERSSNIHNFFIGSDSDPSSRSTITYNHIVIKLALGL